jgi:hypothetical protein
MPETTTQSETSVAAVPVAAPVSDTITDPMQEPASDREREREPSAEAPSIMGGFRGLLSTYEDLPDVLRSDADVYAVAAFHGLPSESLGPLKALVRGTGGYSKQDACAFINLLKHPAWRERGSAGQQLVVEDLIDNPGGTERLCQRLQSRSETTTRLEMLFDMRFDRAVTLLIDGERHSMVWTADGQLGKLLDRVRDRIEDSPANDQIYIIDTDGKHHAAAYAKWNRKEYWAELAAPGQALTAIAEAELKLVTALIGRLPLGRAALKAAEAMAIGSFYRDNRSRVDGLITGFPDAARAAALLSQRGGALLGPAMSGSVGQLLEDISLIKADPGEALRFALVVSAEFAGVKAARFDIEAALGAALGSRSGLKTRLKALWALNSMALGPYRRAMAATARMAAEGVTLDGAALVDALREAGMKGSEQQLSEIAATMSQSSTAETEEMLAQSTVLKEYIGKLQALSGSFGKLGKVLDIL